MILYILFYILTYGVRAVNIIKVCTFAGWIFFSRERKSPRAQETSKWNKHFLLNKDIPAWLLSSRKRATKKESKTLLCWLGKCKNSFCDVTFFVFSFCVPSLSLAMHNFAEISSEKRMPLPVPRVFFLLYRCYILPESGRLNVNCQEEQWNGSVKKSTKAE